MRLKRSVLLLICTILVGHVWFIPCVSKGGTTHVGGQVVYREICYSLDSYQYTFCGDFGQQFLDFTLIGQDRDISEFWIGAKWRDSEGDSLFFHCLLKYKGAGRYSIDISSSVLKSSRKSPLRAESFGAPVVDTNLATFKVIELRSSPTECFYGIHVYSSEQKILFSIQTKRFKRIPDVMAIGVAWNDRMGRSCRFKYSISYRGRGDWNVLEKMFTKSAPSRKWIR